jgi:hypothetical protein
MKIAILMSGRTDLFDRVVDLNHDNLINVLNSAGHTVDMFGSFWEENTAEYCINAYIDYWKVVDIETLTPYTSGVIKNFREHQELIGKYQHSQDNKVSNTLYWLYKLNRLFNIVKEYELQNNMQYDCYIRMRPDVGLHRPFDPDHLNCLTDNNIITHVDHVVHIDGKIYGCGNGWIDDNFCIAKRNAFEVYCGVYDNILSLCNDCQNCISHIIFKRQFELNNIKTLLPNSILVMPKRMPDGVFKYLYFEYVYDHFGYKYADYKIEKCV